MPALINFDDLPDDPTAQPTGAPSTPAPVAASAGRLLVNFDDLPDAPPASPRARPATPTPQAAGITPQQAYDLLPGKTRTQKELAAMLINGGKHMMSTIQGIQQIFGSDATRADLKSEEPIFRALGQSQAGTSAAVGGFMGDMADPALAPAMLLKAPKSVLGLTSQFAGVGGAAGAMGYVNDGQSRFENAVTGAAAGGVMGHVVGGGLNLLRRFTGGDALPYRAPSVANTPEPTIQTSSGNMPTGPAVQRHIDDQLGIAGQRAQQMLNKPAGKKGKSLVNFDDLPDQPGSGAQIKDAYDALRAKRDDVAAAFKDDPAMADHLRRVADTQAGIREIMANTPVPNVIVRRGEVGMNPLDVGARPAPDITVGGPHTDPNDIQGFRDFLHEQELARAPRLPLAARADEQGGIDGFDQFVRQNAVRPDAADITPRRSGQPPYNPRNLDYPGHTPNYTPPRELSLADGTVHTDPNTVGGYGQFMHEQELARAPHLGTTPDGAVEHIDIPPPPEALPASETLANNASGESAASMEAVNRMIAEKAAGQDRMRINVHTGEATPLVTADRVDARAGPNEIIVQRNIGKDEHTILDQGANVGKDQAAGAIARYQMRRDQGGNISQQLLNQLGLTTAGAAAGAAADPDHPLAGAVMGAAGVHGLAALLRSRFGRDAFRTLFGKSVSDIRNIDVPAARDLANHFMAHEYPEAAAIKPDFYQRKYLAEGKYVSALDRLMTPLRQRFGLNKDAMQSVVQGLRTGKVAVKYAKTTAELRSLLEDFHGYMRDAGVNLGHHANYFPREWNTDKIRRNPAAVQDDFVKKMGFTPEEAAKTVSRILNENVGDKSSRLADPDAYDQWSSTLGASQRVMDGGRAARSTAEKSRSIDAGADEHMKDWLISDPQQVLMNYFTRNIRRAEYARFAGADEAKLNNAVRQTIEQMRERGPITGADIKRVTDSIYGLADSVQHRYNLINSESGNLLNNVATNAQIALKLPLSVFASISELAAPWVQAGKFSPKAYGLGLIHSANEAARTVERLVTGMNRIPKAEVTKAAEDMGQVVSATLEHALADRIGAPLGPTVAKIMQLTGLPQLTNYQRVVALETAKVVISRNANGLANGTVSGAKKLHYEQQLRDLGIEPKDAVQWVKAGMPKAGPFTDTMRAAQVRFSNWAITRPTEAQKPLWMNDPHFRQLSLFKTFTTTFSNTFMKRIVTQIGRGNGIQGKLGSLPGLAAMVALANYAYQARNMVAGNDMSQQTPGQQWLNAINNTVAGNATYAADLVGLSNMNGAKGTKGTFVKRAAGLLGPTISDATQLGQAAMTGTSDAYGRFAAHMTPVVNLNRQTRDAAAGVYKNGFEALGAESKDQKRQETGGGHSLFGGSGGHRKGLF